MKTWQITFGVLAAACLPTSTAAMSSSDPPAEPGGRTLELEVFLSEAVHGPGGPKPGDPTLVLEIKRTGDRWERVWGIAGNFSNNHQPGRVLKGKVTDQRIDITLEMTFLPDRWCPGGWAVYTMKLKRTRDGRFEGKYTGKVRRVPVKGRAVGLIRPARRRPKPPRGPARPGEHPRILFRKQDLPGLRKKARTAFGKAALAKLTGAVGLGVKYQLTGDRGLAEQVKVLLKEHMANVNPGSRGRGWGGRLYTVAAAYDLCCDAWPEAFKRKLQRYLAWGSHRIFFKQYLLSSGINWHMCSNYAGPIFHGPAFAGLALWGARGPRPSKPSPTNAGLAVSPAKGYRPGKGVPVCGFRSGHMPDDWIFAGGFGGTELTNFRAPAEWVSNHGWEPDDGTDPLACLGGVGKARPEVGAVVSFGGRTEKFRPVSREKDRGYFQPPGTPAIARGIDIANAVGFVYFSTNYFYTVVRNDEPRWVQVATDYPPGAVYLAGTRLDDGDCVRLEKGLYPFMV